MQDYIAEKLLLDWSDEFRESLSKTNTHYVALFNAGGDLLFSTPAMNALFKGDPHQSILNPTFEKLYSIKARGPLIFEGMLTIGAYNSINTSIVAKVFLKEGKLLIIGGVDAKELLDQNEAMLHLNKQINNLQRLLIKEQQTLKNTYEDLKKVNEELEQLNATKDKFFSIIAHDLKSPFNSIIGFSKILTRRVMEKDYTGIDEYAGIIARSSEYAMELLMNLMEWSRSQTGRMEYNPEKVELYTIIYEVVPLLESIALQKSISIIRNIGNNLVISADKAMISTVLRNLISNAVKFSESGGEITIKAEQKLDQLIVSVSDCGVGIPQSRIERLFIIGENESTEGTNKEKGTGLGLILCKDFIEKHDGKIWVESEVGKGTTFYFSLSCESGNDESFNLESIQESVKNGKSIRKLKILIAEDDETSEKLISIFVKEFGTDIIKVRTGLDAIEQCRCNPDIDLILMDIQMPEMNGLDAIRVIREFNKNVIIIVQTSFAKEGEDFNASTCGCNDLIMKPINKDELQALIKKHFSL